MGDAGAVMNQAQLTTDKLNELYGPFRTEITNSIQRQEQIMMQVQVGRPLISYI